MARKRLSMYKTREILRLRWELGKTVRETGHAVGVSVGKVSQTVERARLAGLTRWAAVAELDDTTLEERLYEPRRFVVGDRAEPDPVWIHLERKRPGVTLELLHLEYLEAHPDGYRYTTFCDRYRTWIKKHRLSMRQVHRAGEKMFVDYSGKRPTIIMPTTGEVTPVELFVAVLGASSYTYGDATLTQKSRDFIGSHIRALEYFGGVAGAFVPDQLKSGVIEACRYEPRTQRTYAEMARHYGTAILPARPGKPRDKAKAEVGVQVVQRWILARIRNEQFFSLQALNERIAELLEDLNARPMRRYGNVSRRELFERLDRPALSPLPSERFVHAHWADATVNIDYHVEYDKHYYSVLYTHVREKVEVRATAMTVEIFRNNRRIASHIRSYTRGRHTTKPEHMPKAHRAHAEWTPSRMISWAAKIGTHAELLVRAILEERPHPEQGYRSCLGVMRLEKRYGADRVDAACRRALVSGGRSYKHVERILKHKLDQLPDDEVPSSDTRPTHANVRGPDYYQ